ncbi:hypothetical protein GCM10011390_41850 [Aureimonas endophytica]|uniref:Uncharacterized protein n=1 Tax=Aureimonas endophytica TaxID=2027858 RepID=A0A916ZYA3_9HYPH|nr:hypothetical protein [Aureimonas endophytica]GGE18305.1 hypothetical protein GCM10011390_41850 [Aureimonas endophytica]
MAKPDAWKEQRSGEQVDRFDDTVCGVCAREATGIGYAPRSSRGTPDRPILWICDDPDCIEIARNSYDMRQEDFTRIESLASHEGGHALEAFCEEIGKFDFREFSQAEFFEANRRMVAGYRSALKIKLRDEAPF